MSWVKYADKILKKDNKIAVDLSCCCPGGCCEDTLVSGVVLKVEVISDTSGCIPAGTIVLMDDSISPEIWSTNGICLHPPWYNGLNLACDTRGTPDQADDRLVLFWENATHACPCPTVDTSTVENFPWGWTLLSKQCSPLEFVYSYCFAEVAPPSGCPCLSGCVVVKVTIQPP